LKKILISAFISGFDICRMISHIWGKTEIWLCLYINCFRN